MFEPASFLFSLNEETGVATITLNRPDRLNALTFEVYEELRRAFAELHDDASVRVALGRLIRSAGLEVETFASAEDLLESWPSESAGCLILDVQLPGWSGLELQSNWRHRVLPCLSSSLRLTTTPTPGPRR